VHDTCCGVALEDGVEGAWVERVMVLKAIDGVEVDLLDIDDDLVVCASSSLEAVEEFATCVIEGCSQDEEMQGKARVGVGDVWHVAGFVARAQRFAEQGDGALQMPAPAAQVVAEDDEGAARHAWVVGRARDIDPEAPDVVPADPHGPTPAL